MSWVYLTCFSFLSLFRVWIEVCKRTMHNMSLYTLHTVCLPCEFHMLYFECHRQSLKTVFCLFSISQRHTISSFITDFVFCWRILKSPIYFCQRHDIISTSLSLLFLLLNRRLVLGSEIRFFAAHRTCIRTLDYIIDEKRNTCRKHISIHPTNKCRINVILHGHCPQALPLSSASFEPHTFFPSIYSEQEKKLYLKHTIHAFFSLEFIFVVGKYMCDDEIATQMVTDWTLTANPNMHHAYGFN